MTCVLRAVIFFMTQYRTKGICLDIMEGHICKLCMNLIPFIFPLSFKEVSVLPLGQRIKLHNTQMPPSKYHCVCNLEKGEDKGSISLRKCYLFWVSLII